MTLDLHTPICTELNIEYPETAADWIAARRGHVDREAAAQRRRLGGLAQVRRWLGAARL